MNKDELLQSLNGEAPNPEQAAMLMDMAMGDTDFFESEGSVPAAAVSNSEGGEPEGDASTAKENDGDDGSPESVQVDDLDSLTADNAVVMAKDGKHQIPFERLAETRAAKQEAEARAAESEARAADAEAKLADLLAQSQQRAQAGEAPTEADQQLAVAQAAVDAGVDPELFGDFSEEALAKGVSELAKQSVADLVAAQVKEHVDKALQPVQARHQEEADNAHMAAIQAAHPDADSIAESAELADWISSQPSFVQQSMQRVLLDGSTQEVIELFSAYKTSTGVVKPAAQVVDVEQAKTAAKQALEKAKAQPPASLTDIAGGRPAAGNKFEVLSQMNGVDMADALAGMSPDQIEAFLNRSM